MNPPLPAFPNDPAEHLLCQSGVQRMQMMQLGSPLAELYRSHGTLSSPWLFFSRLVSPALLFPSLPCCWSRLKAPSRAAWVAEGTLQSPRHTWYESQPLVSSHSRAGDNRGASHVGAGQARKAKRKRKVHFSAALYFN